MANNGINKALLIGNLGKDPEIKVFGDNKKASFTLATSRTYKDPQTGEKVNRVEWHNVVAWGNLADVVDMSIG